MSIIAVIKVEVRKFTSWVRVGLLAALPFAVDIKNAVALHLPDLQPYLPANIYKFVGGAVVIAGILLSINRSRKLVKAENETDNA